MRILIAEDEKDLNRLIVQKLRKENYSVDACFDGEEAISYLDVAQYDAVILDVMMPKADGYEVLKYIRSNGDNTPVLFLTARDAVSERIRGLDSGADDYIIKPFSFDEFLARVRAATRKKHNTTVNVLKVDNLSLDIGKHLVERGGKAIELSPKEFALLEYLMLNRGIVLTREQIENHIWDFDYEGGTNVVDVYVRYLRKKIDTDGEKSLIQTVRGKGYVIR